MTLFISSVGNFIILGGFLHILLVSLFYKKLVGLDFEMLQIVSVHSEGIMVNDPGAGLGVL